MMLFTSHSILRGIFAFLGFFQQPANLEDLFVACVEADHE